LIQRLNKPGAYGRGAHDGPYSEEDNKGPSEMNRQSRRHDIVVPPFCDSAARTGNDRVFNEGEVAVTEDGRQIGFKVRREGLGGAHGQRRLWMDQDQERSSEALAIKLQCRSKF